MSTTIEPAGSAPARNHHMISKGSTRAVLRKRELGIALRTLVLWMCFPVVRLVAVIGNVQYFRTPEQAPSYRECMQHSNRKFLKRRKLSVLSSIH